MNNIYVFDRLDKFKYIVLISLLFIFYLSNPVGSLAASQQESNEIQWSFADHPHPSSNELTAEEISTLELIAASQDSADSCSDKMQALFAVYNERYPDFEKSGSVKKRFSGWTLHILKKNYFYESECITNELFLDVLNSKYSVGMVYCGEFSHKALTEHDHMFVESLEQTAHYIDMGVLAVMNNLLLLHNPGTTVSLNPDVELYIRKYMEKNDEYGQFNARNGVWYTGHLEPLLTPERIEFVNAAVEQGDFRAVLETTSECPTMPK